MNPITAQSQLNIKTYYYLSLYMLYRKRFMIFLSVVIVVMIGAIIYRFITGDYGDSDLSYSYFFVLFYISMPLLTYLGVRRNFKNIKSSSELKTYTFDMDDVNVQCESVNSTFKWSLIYRAKERKNDFLLITQNKLSVHYLPKSGFSSDGDIDSFRELLISLKKMN